METIGAKSHGSPRFVDVGHWCPGLVVQVAPGAESVGVAQAPSTVGGLPKTRGRCGAT